MKQTYLQMIQYVVLLASRKFADIDYTLYYLSDLFIFYFS